jgi:hypothetical protein
LSGASDADLILHLSETGVGEAIGDFGAAGLEDCDESGHGTMIDAFDTGCIPISS